jgi:hypothetical protein
MFTSSIVMLGRLFEHERLVFARLFPQERGLPRRAPSPAAADAAIDSGLTLTRMKRTTGNGV